MMNFLLLAPLFLSILADFTLLDLEADPGSQSNADLMWIRVRIRIRNTVFLKGCGSLNLNGQNGLITAVQEICSDTVSDTV
jgi:hypothetical protein